MNKEEKEQERKWVELWVGKDGSKNRKGVELWVGKDVLSELIGRCKVVATDLGRSLVRDERSLSRKGR